MQSNVLPFFWHLASSSKDTRLGASADLVTSLEGFQRSYLEAKGGQVNGDIEEDEDDEEEEEDDSDESRVEVDGDSGDEDEDDEAAKKLDKQLAARNAEDVVYSLKRLVRGLASSRESSRLGFAVALTEVNNTFDQIMGPLTDLRFCAALISHENCYRTSSSVPHHPLIPAFQINERL